MATAPPPGDIDCYLILRSGKKILLNHYIPSPDELEKKIKDNLKDARIKKKKAQLNKLHQKFLEDDMEMASAYTAGYFAGKSGESPELFIENVKAYCALRNDMAPEKFFPLALQDGAKAWYLNLDEADKKDWEKLQKKFKERYDPPDILNFAQVGDVFATKQGDNEMVRDYISRIQRICHTAKLDEPLTLKAVLNGLLPTLQTFVLPKEPKTLADIEKHAVMAELVAPKPVATTSLQATVDDIQQKMDKLLVASSSPKSAPRSRSPSRHVRFEDERETRTPPNWNQQRGRSPGRPFTSPQPFRRPWTGFQNPQGWPRDSQTRSRGFVPKKWNSPAAPRRFTNPGGEFWPSAPRNLNIVCYNCGQRGHVKRFCRNRFQHGY